MRMDEYQQLEENLITEYFFVNNLKNTEEVVVNVLQNKINGQRILVKYFNGSADVYKKLLTFSHANLPKIHQVVQSDSKCIVVEEFIDGITVGETLEVETYSNSAVKKIVIQLCDVLSMIHQNGIVHRDIKPENIIVENNGRVRLLDFNISRFNKENQSKDTLMLGTTGFAAPEQYGISETDARSDIYSIGILINVMLTGDHPSKKLCTGKWRKIVNKCTRINPKERYSSVKELMADINYYKFIVLLVMVVIVVLVIVTVAVCSERDKLQNTGSKPTPGITELSKEFTKVQIMETLSEEVTSEEVTTEEVTSEEVTTEDVTTPAPTQETVATEPTTTEPTTTEPQPTDEPEELNYFITKEDNIITVTGSGEINVKYSNFTEPYLSSTERQNLWGAVFGEGITNIPSNAFVGCNGFQKITIPNTVTKIGNRALCGTGLDVVELPDSVEYIEEGAFLFCRSMTKIKLPKNLKIIGESAFSGCVTLHSIFIPEGVEYIGEGAFSGSAIRAIVFPSQLSQLEKNTFLCCENLMGIVLPEQLESIGELCFSQCYSLKSIIIPPSVTFIANNAFNSCSDLVIYVTSGSYAEQYCKKQNLKYEYIDSVVFQTIEISPVLDHLENSTFAGDITLEEIKFHDNFVAIDQYCFLGCINLKRMVIPSSVTFIGENAFLGCNNLVIYVTPGSYAEQYCVENNLCYEYVE